MKRLICVGMIFASGLVGVFCLPGSAGAVKAHAAWVQDGSCRLHVYVPGWALTNDHRKAWYGRMQVDTCGGLGGEADIRVESCLQHKTHGRWTTYKPSCWLSPKVTARSILWTSYSVVIHGWIRSWGWSSVRARTAHIAYGKTHYAATLSTAKLV
jgi:hypothetical protein